MGNIDRIITDFYCNGAFGRDYYLEGSEIISEGHDFIVIRKTDGTPEFHYFENKSEKQSLIDEWTK